MNDERNREVVADDADYKENKKDSMVIIKWHNIIRKESSKFDAFLEPANMLKNRVKLLGDKVGDDYYHASYADSCDRPGFGFSHTRQSMAISSNTV
uniref:Uncharacterized protein n=1 Tax=Onchocerca volvulus TaxID=6282 RepID=A0A8R1TTI3_ONCVO